MNILRNRILAHWPIKLLGGSLLTVLFCTTYLALQRYALFAPSRLSLTAVDRFVTFAPAWTWMYLSVYPLLLLAWLISRVAGAARASATSSSTATATARCAAASGANAGILIRLGKQRRGLALSENREIQPERLVVVVRRHVEPLRRETEIR